ncbi:hypothetical protein ATANTOWER_002515 [Ataeniobius toweri]|uniref:Uncharacterized protein n=1 Tax=Ataeniobius toweri TaxID=208326 RepID=A0ABU7A3Y1_9TELE|nr:hypothetical protein [Ataeniobius toweri]
MQQMSMSRDMIPTQAVLGCDPKIACVEDEGLRTTVTHLTPCASSAMPNEGQILNTHSQAERRGQNSTPAETLRVLCRGSGYWRNSVAGFLLEGKQEENGGVIKEGCRVWGKFKRYQRQAAAPAGNAVKKGLQEQPLHSGPQSSQKHFLTWSIDRERVVVVKWGWVFGALNDLKESTEAKGLFGTS